MKVYIVFAVVQSRFADIFNRTKRQSQYVQHDCLPIRELPEQSGDKNKCSALSCWESQMRDPFRHSLLKTINKFRERVSDGSCLLCKDKASSSIYVLAWHWKLEVHTQKVISTCPHKKFTTNFKLNVDRREMSCETSTISYAAQSATQAEANYMMKNLQEDNYLNDFDSELNFRRATMNWVGCAFISRQVFTGETGTGKYIKDAAIAHISCTYCADKESQYTTNLCPKNDTTYPHLCAGKAMKLRVPCEVKPHCNVHDRTPSWMFLNTHYVLIHYRNHTSELDQRTFEHHIAIGKESPSKYTDQRRIITPIVNEFYPVIFTTDATDQKHCIFLSMVSLLVLVMFCFVVYMIVKYQMLMDDLQ